MRIIIALVVAGAMIISCKNEPYSEAFLAVANLVNHALDSGTSLTYSYRGSRIYKFQATTKTKTSVVTTTTTSARFNYDFNNGRLINAVIDSTGTSYKVDTFYGYGSSVVTDSTKLYDTTGVSLFSTRTVTYNEDGKPATVNLKLHQATGVLEQNAELTWDGGNVVRLVATNVTAGTTYDLSIGYDGKNSAFKNAPDYVYTLSLQKLFWLSENNPIVFHDGGPERKFTFSYNKFDYPTNFRSERNVQFSATYSAVDPEK